MDAILSLQKMSFNVNEEMLDSGVSRRCSDASLFACTSGVTGEV